MNDSDWPPVPRIAAPASRIRGPCCLTYLVTSELWRRRQSRADDREAQVRPVIALVSTSGSNSNRSRWIAGTGAATQLNQPTRDANRRLLASSECDQRSSRNATGVVQASGVRNISRRSIVSLHALGKRDSRPAGSWARSSGAIKRAHIACNRRGAGKLSHHHCCQRRTIRSAKASCCAKCRAAAGVGPWSDISATASARCTRRQRKRTDTAVTRRHRAQQTALGEIIAHRSRTTARLAWKMGLPPQG
jgi:hypothetical protein